MADNTVLNAPTVGGGDVIRTELIGGAKFQAVKIALGVVDAFDADLSSTNPMPMEFVPTSAQLTSGIISISGSGDNTVIVGVGVQVIKVYRMMFVCSEVVSVTIKDGATPLSGAMSFSANGGLILDFQSEPWYTTSAGASFVISLSSGVQVSGTVYYTQV